MTPASGMLSFERFVAGLKICLLRSRAEALSQWQQQQQVPPQQQQSQQPAQRQPRPPSAPALEQLSAGGQLSAGPAPVPPPPAARPHSVIGQQRTLSMPQLSGAAAGDQPPPKPPRDRSRDTAGPPLPPPPSSQAANLSRTQILSALQRWHRERVQRGRGDGKDVLPPADPPSSSEAEHELAGPAAAAAPAPANPARKTAGQRKREPRRHTLQNGIDYNMVSAADGGAARNNGTACCHAML